jgi:NAD(P)-dependent dehydrogenase (short-subunit alcohol dehydrogenase family)
MDLGLKGKHAIVTGGSLGIGKAIARELAREGADVALVARTKDTLETAAKEIATETGRRVIPLVADVTSRAQVDAMVAQSAAQLGGLHILVNSGSPPGGSATATGPIETVVDEDLLQDFNVKYVGRAPLRPRGHPLHEGAGLGPHHQYQRHQRAQRGQPERRRAKHLPRALHQDARRAARPLRDHRQLHPSGGDAYRAHSAPARRPRQGARHLAEDVEKRDFADDSPRGNAIGRMVDASEIAYLTAFLASDKAWAVSGELVVATGGAGRSVYY